MGLHNELQSEMGASSDNEFTASARMGRTMEWYEPPALSLDETGVIQECSESCEELFGYSSLELVKQHISWLFPQLSGHTLMMEGCLNPMVDFLCHCGHPFYAQHRQGGSLKSGLNFIRLEHGGRSSLRLIVRSLGAEQAPLPHQRFGSEPFNLDQIS